MKKIIAYILDFLLSFIVFGYIIGLLTGSTTSEGFNLQGGSAFVLFGLVAAYFIVLNKYFGGTLVKRLMGV